MTIDIRRAAGSDARKAAAEFAGLLIDCVESGASIGFLKPLPSEDAVAYWHAVSRDVDAGDTTLLVARDRGELVGLVQVQFVPKPNQPHRAEIAKLLVAPSRRRQGIGELLMAFAESEAKAAGRTLLVLDTERGGPAEPLYRKRGWKRAGIIPNFALKPDGVLADTVIFYKEL